MLDRCAALDFADDALCDGEADSWPMKRADCLSCQRDVRFVPHCTVEEATAFERVVYNKRLCGAVRIMGTGDADLIGYLHHDQKLALFQQTTNILRGTRNIRFSANFKDAEDPFNFMTSNLPGGLGDVFTLGDINDECVPCCQSLHRCQIAFAAAAVPPTTPRISTIETTCSH